MKTAELRRFGAFVARNTKAYFKNKFNFFLSLITPLILLVLFVTFLRNVYIESFRAAFPEGFAVDPRLLNGVVGAWLMSSILSVSSVTVAFSSNIIMVEDKVNGCINDFRVAPVRGTTISVGYFVSNFLVTLLVMLAVMLIGHIYLAAVGWYISVADTFMIIVDVVLSVLFGTLLAGVVESFISSQGGMSAVSVLVSSMYGFISGAYMPLSSFSSGLRSFIGLLPGTYGMNILRNRYMSGYINAMADAGLPAEAIDGIKTGFDMKLEVFGADVSLGAAYGILLGACAVLLAAYIAIVIIKNRRLHKKSGNGKARSEA